MPPPPAPPVLEPVPPVLPVRRQSQAPVKPRRPVERDLVRRRMQELRVRQTQAVLQAFLVLVQKLVAPVVRRVLVLHQELVRRTALPVLARMPVVLPDRLVPDRMLVARLVPLVLARMQEARRTVAPENFHTALRRLVAVA